MEFFNVQVGDWGDFVLFYFNHFALITDLINLLHYNGFLEHWTI